jgi:Txe/YoeB family toxin of Txe-Axe toxin-antitoxin module
MVKNRLHCQAGFSTKAEKTAEDWAEYWDRRIANQARCFGIKRTAKIYGLETETVADVEKHNFLLQEAEAL